jgi:histidine triad (HIT) family protein
LNWLPKINSFLLPLARSPLAAYFIGWLFAHASFLLPVNRLYESKTLIVFVHPKPVYPTHCLLVPKKAIRGIESLHAVDGNTLVEVMSASREVAQQLGLIHYQLVINAGAYQEVPQIHFHLISTPLP